MLTEQTVPANDFRV